ncbi:MAG: 2-carboxy-1,4-naphthoquinone phytyltransferase [Thermostichales cyanobacterium BF4_bins_65]
MNQNHDGVTLPSPQELWRAALKIPMYSVAIMPILGGTSLAWQQQRLFAPGVLSLLLTASILILVWMNVSNDVFDHETGIDVHKYHSLVYLTKKPRLLLGIAHGCLAIALGCIAWISWWQRDGTLLLLIGLACFLGYTYQGPPFRLGYLGLGEPICFFCFGPLGIQAAYYSQTQAWTWQSLPLGTVIGLTTTLILFCSHFHQVDDDLAAGKRSPVVRLGSRRAAALIPYACGLIYGLTVVFVGMGWLPWLSLGILVTLPLAYRLSQLLLSSYDQYARISHSKFVAVQLHFWSGMILCLSLVLA